MNRATKTRIAPHKNNWATLLANARLRCNCDVVPKGWQTMREIADESHLPVRTARERVNSLLGKSVERRKFRTERKDGTRHTLYHYKKIK